LVAFDTQNPPRALTADSEIFHYLKEYLPDGFTIEVTDHGLGRVSFFAKRGAPNIIFNVHIDTVPIVTGWESDPHTLQQSQDKVIGLGACDIKGAAACLLALAHQDERDLALLFTTDEEGADGYCVKAFVASEQAKSFQQAIVAEPTQCRAIVEHAGYVSVKGKFKGFSGHSSNLNALKQSANHAAIQWGQTALNFVNVHYADNSQARFNIGKFNGGVKGNISAGETAIHWSARLDPGADTQKFITSVKACSPKDSDVSWIESFYGEPLPNAEFSNQKAKTFCAENGLNIGTPVGFWTEAAVFNQVGIPAIVLGPGNIEQAHTANEWVLISQLQDAFAIYERLSR